MIPENKIESVKTALKAAFDTNEFDKIKTIATGLSGALVFRIEEKDKPSAKTKNNF